MDAMQENANFMEHIMRGSMALMKIAAIAYEYNQRELVFQHDKVKLYHYRATVKKNHTTPVLVVFATVNRPEILDIFPEHSFIRGLLENKMDVYLLDWGYPDLNDKHLSLNDYISYLNDCVTFIKEKTQLNKVDLLGICQGGLLCLCYALLYQTINKLVLISTPIDFHTSDNTIAKFLNQIDVNNMVSVMGNVSGAWLTQFFISLRPFELIGKKYLRFVDNISDEEMTNRFLRIEKWLYDAPDQAGVAFTEFAHDYYRDNKLIKGEIRLQGKRLDLKNLNIPVLNVMAEEDEIIPMSSSKALKTIVSDKLYNEITFPSGHIGIYVSDKVGKAMPSAIAKWLINDV